MAENATEAAAEAASGASMWFPALPSWRVDAGEWRLDIITLLAVIGESSMVEHSQAITASVFCLLPRLLPAPQALLKPTRPARMPETPAKMIGVQSGFVMESVGFFANIIQPMSGLKPYTFKVVEIKHREEALKRQREGRRRGLLGWLGDSMVPSERQTGGRQATAASPAGGSGNNASGKGVNHHGHVDIEKGTGAATGAAAVPNPGIRRRQTAKEKVTNFVTYPTRSPGTKRPAVPMKLTSPTHILSVFSCLLTVGLLITAAIWTDAPAMIAVGLISLASTVVGYASWWKPILMQVPTGGGDISSRPGDVVVRTREGAFIYVRCSEAVARELFFGTEECRYRVPDRWFRLLMGLGTVMLMLSVVLLGNCSWYMQLFVATAYIFLNGAYWGISMVPKDWFWDLSRYEWNDVTEWDAKNADQPTDYVAERKRRAAAAAQAPGESGGDGGGRRREHRHAGFEDTQRNREDVPSFTRTLWWVIRETKVTGWVQRSGACPPIDQYKEWLEKAEAAAQSNDRGWEAVLVKDEIMNRFENARKRAAARDGREQPLPDPATEQMPLSEVQSFPVPLRSGGGF